MIPFGEGRMVTDMVTDTAMVTVMAMAMVMATVMELILKRKLGKKSYLRKNKLFEITSSRGFRFFMVTFCVNALI